MTAADGNVPGIPRHLHAVYGAYLCDTLLRLAEARAFRPLWSAGVLDELERNLVERGLPKQAVLHRIAEMRRSFPDAEVRGYDALAENTTCDPKDRHVLAATVRADAEVLVTFNTGDFPAVCEALLTVEGCRRTLSAIPGAEAALRL